VIACSSFARRPEHWAAVVPFLLPAGADTPAERNGPTSTTRDRAATKGVRQEVKVGRVQSRLACTNAPIFGVLSHTPFREKSAGSKRARGLDPAP
jgi:hypothetical protein